MDKKGFTLTELIATIAIIAVVTTISVTTFQTVHKKTVQKQKSNILISLKADAKAYTTNKKVSTVNVDTLLKSGYTDADKEVNGWKVIMDPNPDDKDFPYLNCYIYNETTDSISPGNYNANTLTCLD